MKILYIDEAGGFEAPTSTPSATPLMVIAGVVFDHQTLPALTDQFLKLKARFYPGKIQGAAHLLDYVLAEVKGPTSAPACAPRPGTNVGMPSDSSMTW